MQTPHLLRQWVAALLLTAVTGIATPSASAQEVLVSDPDQSLIDPDFDQGHYQLTWGDESGRLWVGTIDPDTGDFNPPSGQGVLVDTNIANEFVFGNGPVYGFGDTGPAILYTRYDSQNRFSLGSAQFDGTSWVTKTLPNSTNKYGPTGSDSPALKGALSYLTTENQLVLWRNLDSSGAQFVIPGAQFPGVRWVPNERAVVFRQPAGGNNQIFTYNIDTSVLTQITFDAPGKLSAFIWQAPEYGGDDCLMTLTSDKLSVRIYHNQSGSWQFVTALAPPTTSKYLWSPQPFVYNGKSYIYMIASPSKNQKSLTVPTEVWIAGVDPAQPFYRRVSDPTLKVRKNPKAFTTSQAEILYFQVVTQGANPIYQMYRADTGLGPPQTAPSQARSSSAPR